MSELDDFDYDLESQYEDRTYFDEEVEDFDEMSNEVESPLFPHDRSEIEDLDPYEAPRVFDW